MGRIGYRCLVLLWAPLKTTYYYERLQKEITALSDKIFPKGSLATSTEYFAFRLAISFFARSHVQNWFLEVPL